jgi:hypothetical protein
MTTWHETALEHLINAADAFDSAPMGKHPLLEQLVNLALQMLIAWLTEYLAENPLETTPAP